MGIIYLTAEYGEISLEDETTYRNRINQELIQTLNKLMGLKCIKYSILERKHGHNGIMALHLGENFLETGDYVLVIYCLWRIETKDRVLGSFIGRIPSFQTKTALSQLLNPLVDSHIEDIKIIQPSFDLELEFANKTKIRVAVGGTQNHYTNYSFFVASSHGYQVEDNGRINYIAQFSAD
jgi:hypothetical protein